MIRKLEVEDIAGIMHLEGDNVTENFPCDPGEWVQWLVSNAENPRVLIIGNAIDGEIKSYLVAMDNVMLPLSVQVQILHFYSGGGLDENIAIFDMLNNWARGKGAKIIRGVCKNIKVFEKYGAKQTGIMGGYDL